MPSGSRQGCWWLALTFDRSEPQGASRGFLDRSGPEAGAEPRTQGTAEPGASALPLTKARLDSDVTNWDAWHHFQIVIDVKAKTFRVLMQVLGEPPREFLRGTLRELPPANALLAMELFCRRTQPRADGPAFDNLQVSRHPARILPSTVCGWRTRPRTASDSS